MIRIEHGNLFKSGAQALVNPVNTVGVMGKGLAKAFCGRYPANFYLYREACFSGVFSIGTILPVEAPSGEWILNFPTKKHWRDPSQMDYIERGLPVLIDTVRELELSTVAVPALGCGLGGLRWAWIEKLLRAQLEPAAEIEWIVYAPLGEVL